MPLVTGDYLMVFPVILLLMGGAILYAGMHDMTVTDVLRTALGRQPKDKLGSLLPSGTTQDLTGGNPVINAPSKITNLGPVTNPVPGATGSRLDQGMDGTSKDFLSPFDGTVVYSVQSDPGWNGGGYVAVQSAKDPKRVYYVAEGLAPVVTKGQHVQAGQRIAIPRSNPYNGIVGNYENGWADPSSPGRPLAQATSNAAQEVMGFYHWLLSLGGPKATSTSNAGRP